MYLKMFSSSRTSWTSSCSISSPKLTSKPQQTQPLSLFLPPSFPLFFFSRYPLVFFFSLIKSQPVLLLLSSPMFLSHTPSKPLLKNPLLPPLFLFLVQVSINFTAHPLAKRSPSSTTTMARRWCLRHSLCMQLTWKPSLRSNNMLPAPSCSKENPLVHKRGLQRLNNVSQPMFLESDWSLNRKSYRFMIH